MKRPAARLKHTTAEDDHDHNPEEWELRYRTARSGRENRVIFYCRKCGHREKPQPWPLQAISVAMSHCPVCRASMFFVAYQEGAEDALAKLLMESGGLGE